jgi:hypothetical protein
VETLASLENALLEFPGCAVVISPRPLVPRPGGHHILAWEGDEETRRSGSGSRATSSPTSRTRSSGSAPRRARPHAVTYRKLPATEPRHVGAGQFVTAPTSRGGHGSIRPPGPHALVGHWTAYQHVNNKAYLMPTSSRPASPCSSSATTPRSQKAPSWRGRRSTTSDRSCTTGTAARGDVGGRRRGASFLCAVRGLRRPTALCPRMTRLVPSTSRLIVPRRLNEASGHPGPVADEPSRVTSARPRTLAS